MSSKSVSKITVRLLPWRSLKEEVGGCKYSYRPMIHKLHACSVVSTDFLTLIWIMGRV
jgi:hypothetical protein